MLFMKFNRNLNIIFLILLLASIFGACDENTSDKKYKVEKTTVNKIDVLTNLGNDQWKTGNYKEALKYFTQAYNQVKGTANEQQMATLLNNLGLVHWRLENNDAAMECYDEAAKLAEKLDMPRLLGLTYTNRALILKEQRKFDEAFNFNNEAISIFIKLKEPRDLAIAYNNQGQIYRFSDQPQQALNYYNLSLKECEKIAYLEGMATAYQNLSTIFTAIADPEKAYSNAHKGLKISLKLNSKVRISEAYRELSSIHERFAQPDSALYYFKMYYHQEKRLMAAAQSETLSRYQANMGFEVKNLRIKNLKNERQIANNRLWFIAIGTLAVLFTIIFLLYRHSSKIRVKKNQLEAELRISRKLIEIKELELKTYIIDLSKKNSIINDLQGIAATGIVDKRQDEEVANLIARRILTDEDWEVFKIRFAGIYPHFFDQLKESLISITEAEVRILVLMRLNLRGIDMANTLGISPQSVRVCKMRLKKKLSVEGYNTVEEFLEHIVK
jgi:tetratricopeptide (TPR) repeat protein